MGYNKLTQLLDYTHNYKYCLFTDNIYLFTNYESDIYFYYAISVLNAKKPEELEYVADIKYIYKQLQYRDVLILNLTDQKDKEIIKEEINNIKSDIKELDNIIIDLLENYNNELMEILE